MNFRFFFSAAGVARSEALNLANRQTATRSALRVTHAQLWINDRKKRTAMTSSEFRLLNPLLNGRFQFQQSNCVRNGCTVLARALGNGFLGKLKSVHQTLKRTPCLDGIQIFTLDVFNESHFKRKLVGNLPDDGGNLF